MSTKLVTITPSNVAQFKAVRLAALQDSPTAFGSTYAKEAQFTHAAWLARAHRWDGDAGIGHLAMDGHACVGLLLCVLDETDLSKAHAISMWVDPRHRRRGVG